MNFTRITAAIALVMAIAAMVGCGRATHIGVRTGVDIPLQSVKKFEHRTDSMPSSPSVLQRQSYGTAPAIGLSFRTLPPFSSEEKSKNTFFMFEPSVRFDQRDQFLIREGTDNHFVEIDVEYTNLNLPMYVGQSFPIHKWNVVPYAALALGLSVELWGSMALRTYSIGEDGAKVYTNKQIERMNNTSDIFVAGLVGANWRISTNWSLFLDVRYRLSLGSSNWQDLTILENDWCQTYEIATPVKHLGFSVTALLNL